MRFDFTRRKFLAAGGAAFATPGLTLGGARAQESPTAAPLFHTRRVGDLEITAISDGYFPLEPGVFLGIEPAALDAALADAFIRPEWPMPTGVTAHLVRGGGRTVLIDAGTADLFGPSLGRHSAALAALDVDPGSIDAVLVTHMHPDHIGGLLVDGAPAFPNAALHVSETDLGFWTDAAIAAQAPDDFKPFFARAAATAAAYGDRLTPFTGDVEVTPGVTALALPGHTLGHTGYLLASGDASLLVFGDAANVASVQFARPDVALAFDTDPALGIETRKRLLDMAATDRLLVAGTHMPFPAFGHVARSGEAYAWAPAEWQYQ